MSTLGERLKRYYAPGDVIFNDGDAGQTMFIVLEGEIEISKVLGDQKTVLELLKTGSIFGEMCLIDNQPRSAAATAVSKAVLLEISREMFRSRMEEVPKWLRGFFAILVERLRSATKNQSILLARGAGRQVINIVALMARQTEPDTHDKIILEWATAVSTTSFMLGFNEERVNDTMNLLVTAKLAESDRREGMGRVLIISDTPRFFQFADFCRDRYMLETGHAQSMSEQFKFGDVREPELLEAIKAIVSAEGAAEDFPIDALEKALKEKFDKPLEKYKSLLDQYSKEGLLDTFKPEGSEPALRVNNRELFEEKMAKMRLLVEFGEVEKKIMA